jgi:glucokinase
MIGAATMTGAATIGIDVGGTAIKLGLVDADGRILARRRLAYAAMASFDCFVDAVSQACRAIEGESDRAAAAIGVAAPGHARLSDGIMVDGTANVPLLRGRSLAAALGRRLGRPVVALNDGAAATVGELVFGAGRGLARFALITLGTGVGGGVVIDGRVVSGDDGEPPEIGAMMIEPGRGAGGTLEALACAGGFAAAYAAAGGAECVPPEAIFDRAATGDPAAAEALDATCRRIAQACGIMVNLLNLQACFIGGGIASAGAPLRDRVRAHLEDFTWPFLLARSRLDLAATGADAGLLGAAAWAARRSS